MSGYALLAFAMGAATYLALARALTVGSVIAVFELLWFMISAVQQLSNVVEPFQRAAAGLRRVQELLDQKPEVAERPGAADLPPLSGSIRFESVDFAFAGGEAVLRDVDLTLPARQTVAIVGQSGSGKSTLLALLLRFHDPSRGTVRFDDYDVSRVTLASLALQVGAVFQDSFLFDASLADNIRLGRLEARRRGDRGGRASGRRGRVHPRAAGRLRDAARRRRRAVVGRAAPADRAGPRPGAASSRARSGRGDLGPGRGNGSGHRRHPREPPRRADARVRDAPPGHRAQSDLIVVMAEGRVAEQGTHEARSRRAASTRGSGSSRVASGERERREAAIQPQRLAAIPIFSGVGQELLARLAARFTTMDVPIGQTLFEEDERGDKLYVIVRGRVGVSRRGPGGAQLHVSVLEDGDFFGEIALLEEVRRTATVRTLAPTLLLVLDRGEFQALLAEAPALGRSSRERPGARRAALCDASASLAGPVPL